MATMLRDDLLPWVQAGRSPDAGNIPCGAMQHVYPTAKPDRPQRRIRSYLVAASDLRTLITSAI
jgi:hypothetical protein